MAKQQHSFWRSPTRPWASIPKWLLPIVVILIAGAIFLIAQYVTILILSLYAGLRGWNTVVANNWLSGSVSGQFVSVLLFESFNVALLWALLRRYGKSLATIGLKRLRARDGAIALIAYPVYLVFYFIGLGITSHFIHGLNLNQAQNIGFNSVHGSTQLILTFISLVVLPPIAEELLFRGFIFEGLKKTMPVIYAGILTSVLFAAAHLPEGGSSGLFWVGAVDVFFLSLVLVYLKQKTKTLWPGIFLHAIKNTVAFVYLFVLTNR